MDYKQNDWHEKSELRNIYTAVFRSCRNFNEWQTSFGKYLVEHNVSWVNVVTSCNLLTLIMATNNFDIEGTTIIKYFQAHTPTDLGLGV